MDNVIQDPTIDDLKNIISSMGKTLNTTTKNIYLYCKNDIWYAEVPEIPGCAGNASTEKDAKNQVLSWASYWFNTWVTKHEKPKWQKPREPEWYEKVIPIHFSEI
jgi:predicted RNase H-like HicB family nuclease